jgi:hypothetical protein
VRSLWQNTLDYHVLRYVQAVFAAFTLTADNTPGNSIAAHKLDIPPPPIRRPPWRQRAVAHPQQRLTGLYYHRTVKPNSPPRPMPAAQLVSSDPPPVAQDDQITPPPPQRQRRHGRQDQSNHHKLIENSLFHE